MGHVSGKDEVSRAWRHSIDTFEDSCFESIKFLTDTCNIYTYTYGSVHTPSYNTIENRYFIYYFFKANYHKIYFHRKTINHVAISALTYRQFTFSSCLTSPFKSALCCSLSSLSGGISNVASSKNCSYFVLLVSFISTSQSFFRFLTINRFF